MENPKESQTPAQPAEAQPLADAMPPPAGAVRILAAGALMGVANIIPGVSGGTMILALGLYQRFVTTVAEITRLRFRLPSLVFLGLLFGAGIVAIGALSWPMTWALENIHHVMFALFIGLTLGGVPVLLREIESFTPAVIVGAIGGFALMALIAAAQQVALPETWMVYFFAGILASSAMVLPGISGSYLLLLFGLYYPVTESIRNFLSALKDMDMAAMTSIGGGVLLPVAIGIVAGIAGLTNGLKWLLDTQKAPTMGVLLGLLVGSVMGLYPFKALLHKGEVVAEAHAPTLANIALVLVVAVIGFAITVALSRFGARKPASEEHPFSSGS